MEGIMEREEISGLIRQAIAMLDKAYVPYSHHRVGAALLTGSGSVYTGCNIENAGLTATNCAERTAFFKAVSDGVRDFKAIAIVGGLNGVLRNYCAPCGVCRQVMMEFCDPETFLIITAKSPTDYRIHTLAQYLPDGFGPADLQAGS
jgi:cytidine deaminase